MGVKAGVPRGGRPNLAAYYVALAGIGVLMALLCCYFCYFFLTRVKELSRQESPTQTPAQPTAPAAYPVQPVVRDSATAMARLCRQTAVFPAATSPAALHTGAGDTLVPGPPQVSGAPQVTGAPGAPDSGPRPTDTVPAVPPAADKPALAAAIDNALPNATDVR